MVTGENAFAPTGTMQFQGYCARASLLDTSLDTPLFTPLFTPLESPLDTLLGDPLNTLLDNRPSNHLDILLDNHPSNHLDTPVKKPTLNKTSGHKNGLENTLDTPMEKQTSNGHENALDIPCIVKQTPNGHENTLGIPLDSATHNSEHTYVTSTIHVDPNTCVASDAFKRLNLSKFDIESLRLSKMNTPNSNPLERFIEDYFILIYHRIQYLKLMETYTNSLQIPDNDTTQLLTIEQYIFLLDTHKNVIINENKTREYYTLFNKITRNLQGKQLTASIIDGINKVSGVYSQYTVHCKKLKIILTQKQGTSEFVRDSHVTISGIDLEYPKTWFSVVE
jgi:hypothetical protein